MIHIRRAGPMDSRAMADLLNEINHIGATTKFTSPITGDTIIGWMSVNCDCSAWHIAENDAGDILGYQSIAPQKNLPPRACDIATFVRNGETELGIGSKLFEASRKAAWILGYDLINATIRADNAGGLAYYQSLGFEPYRHHTDTPKGDRSLIDRVSKRFDLTK